MSHLNNVLVRVENAAKTIDLDKQTLDTLRGFKLDWGCDIEAQMDDGSTRRFKAVRIWHRSPHVDQPHKGGIRYHQDVNEDMMKAHAIEMSIKCWIMGLEWGGAKGGVAVNPLKHSLQELKAITEKLVDEMDERNILGPFRDVPAPDVGTNPKIMNWIRQRYATRRRSREDARFAGVVTGKPVGYGFGGIPGRNEATGFGLVSILERVFQKYRLYNFDKLYGLETRVAVMGFGNVGSHVAFFIRERFPHFKIVAVSDVSGGIYNGKGLDIAKLNEHVQATKKVIGAPGSIPLTSEELIELDCDILIPAALENVITLDNADRIKAKIILEGANGPTTPEADEILKSKNVLVIPDILANAGGVTVSFFEWARNVNIKDERVPRPKTKEVLERLNEMMVTSTDEVIEVAETYKTDLRNAAYITAIKRAAPLFRTKHLAE
ncbi:MAG: hypothetical protein A2750_03610 [Candidatus Yanofskybacteria bacterium RIFCSPHIGHO2_01_FULL_45_42]|uniref:Glutamate dehydrogenase n=2 Tax=Candidatus Yanofskyibacteriota TaxID=1752733 RepID=A0A1F8FL04_9BACT|nr:MAG: hypothetical protein A2750_03610 [Candidatus Yanofskybacteria bacterium RIFCSPHIGHO2_01_FULL_45_42]OGN13877.1 MAG: hypothetical protein A3J47_00375 [Candidatus Yanofskybacteria bacterium RIFCSPHIGHO2_02_FULL_43_22]